MQTFAVRKHRERICLPPSPYAASILLDVLPLSPLCVYMCVFVCWLGAECQLQAWRTGAASWECCTDQHLHIWRTPTHSHKHLNLVYVESSKDGQLSVELLSKFPHHWSHILFLFASTLSSIYWKYVTFMITSEGELETKLVLVYGTLINQHREPSATTRYCCVSSHFRLASPESLVNYCHQLVLSFFPPLDSWNLSVTWRDEDDEQGENTWRVDRSSVVTALWFATLISQSELFLADRTDVRFTCRMKRHFNKSVSADDALYT